MEAVAAICADTDIIVDYLRGREPGRTAYRMWRGRVEVFLTTISAFELLMGAQLSSRRAERMTEVMSLLEQHPVLTFDTDGAEEAAKKGSELRKIGATIEIRDLFNGAICLSKGLPILTKNKAHYERIIGLTVISP
ncbi:MAG: type II toxin-antitoxin system VapC family toxin [Candidatus Bathyarchaeia archaeon]